jgi:hypothetical protein
MPAQAGTALFSVVERRLSAWLSWFPEASEVSTDKHEFFIQFPESSLVYIDADGSMSYTIQHSAYVPPGAILDGWNKTENVGESFGTLEWSSGLIACPPATEGTGWQVFGQVENATFSPDCLGFNALTSTLIRIQD